MAFIKKNWFNRPNNTPIDADGLNDLESRIGNYDDTQNTRINELIDLVAGKASRNVIHTYVGNTGSNNIGTITIPEGLRNFMLIGHQVQSTGGDWHTVGAIIGCYVNAIGSQVTVTTVPAYAGRPFRITTSAYNV